MRAVISLAAAGLGLLLAALSADYLGERIAESMNDAAARIENPR